MAFSVYPIDILHVNDNYVWAITPHNSNKAYVVDPGEAEAVLRWLQAQKRELAGILITHHHWDHVTGIDGLLERHPVPVWGPAIASLPQISEVVNDGDVLSLHGITLEVMAIPGHTRDHIAYYSQADGSPALFCGDTLFASGCGRVFDGTAEDLHQSLSRLAQLPPQTQVYCAHEYTLKNLAFAAAVEPQNSLVFRRRKEVEQLRQKGAPSLPTNLDIELAANPFLRCAVPEVLRSAENYAGCELANTTEVFKALRRWKDSF